MTITTKQRMIEEGSTLLRTRGMASTSFTDVLAASGAARGAIYHHFPGGKAELAREIVAWSGRSVRDRLSRLSANKPQEVVTGFLAAVRPVVEQSANGTSCAVAAVTVEAAQYDPELTEAVRTALLSWVDALNQQLVQAGAKPRAAASVAMLMVTFLEGTHVLCRAVGTLEPFDLGSLGIEAAAKALLG